MHADRIFFHLTRLCAIAVIVLVGTLAAMLIVKSLPALRVVGWEFPFRSAWDPVSGDFGAFPFLYGTVISSIAALAIAVPVSLGIAIFLSEFCPPFLCSILSALTELLAAIPSVIYGLWGLFYLVPWLRETVEPLLAGALGFLPLFQGPPLGIGVLAASLILSVMLIPIISSIAREVLHAVPTHQREAALALGATRWEATTFAVLRFGGAGILGAIFLGLGRALGETMAVTMLIGNQPTISASLFAPGATMASVLANEFTEATDDLHLSVLFCIGLLLFSVTFVMNALARSLVFRIARRGEGRT